MTTTQWILLVTTRVTGTVGRGLLATAHSRSPATLLEPCSYLQILSAVGIGWLVFGQLPDRITAVCIVRTCLAGAGVAVAEGSGSPVRAAQGRPQGR